MIVRLQHFNNAVRNYIFRDHPFFSAFLQEYREYAKGEGVNLVVCFQKLILATVPVHETSLADQHFYSMHLGRREGYSM